MKDFVKHFIDEKNGLSDGMDLLINVDYSKLEERQLAIKNSYIQHIMDSIDFKWTKIYSQLETIEDIKIYFKENQKIFNAYDDFFQEANKRFNFNGIFIKFDDTSEGEGYILPVEESLFEKWRKLVPEVFSFTIDGVKIYCKSNKLYSEDGNSININYNEGDYLNWNITKEDKLINVKYESSNNVDDFIKLHNLTRSGDWNDTYCEVVQIIEEEIYKRLLSEVKDRDMNPILFQLKYGDYGFVDFEDLDDIESEEEIEEYLLELSRDCLDQNFVESVTNTLECE